MCYSRFPALVQELRPTHPGTHTHTHTHTQAVREGRTLWTQLSDREKAEVLLALDSVRLDSLGMQVRF